MLKSGMINPQNIHRKFKYFAKIILVFWCLSNSAIAGLNLKVSVQNSIKNLAEINSKRGILTPSCKDLYQASVSDSGSDFASGLHDFNVYLDKKKKDLSHIRHAPVLLHKGQKTKTVVLFIHGLFESPQYEKGIIKNLNDQGINVFAPLLSGHWSKDPKAMEQVKFQDWLNDLNESIAIAKKLGKNVILAGYSTGGLLAIRGALENPADVKGLLLFAPAIHLTQKTYWSTQYGATFKKTLNDQLNLPADGVDVAYFSPMAGKEVINLISDTLNKFSEKDDFTAASKRKKMAQQIKVPTQIIMSEEDETVSPESIKDFYMNIPSKKNLISFAQGSDIKHGNITKAKEDVFVGWEDRYNFQFDSMMKKIDNFIDN